MILNSSLFMQFDKLRFGFSTKLFNYKNSPFYSNMSFEIGDDNQKVLSNRQTFAKSLEIDLTKVTYQHQIHSDIITYVYQPMFIGDSDAMYTDKKNIALTASSADCNTIYLYDFKEDIIAAIHSGWRGTQKKIVMKTLIKMKEKFNCLAENIIAYLAPAISVYNYEIGREVSVLFDDKFVKKYRNKFYLDVTSCNYKMLLDFGIPKRQIQKSNLCSFENVDLFHSYRRDKENSGRAWGLIYMVE